MNIIKDNIWNFHSQHTGVFIIVPTNGVVKKNGEAVMGAGLAKQAAKKFIGLPLFLGNHLKRNGNICGFFPELGILTFPVKDSWFKEAELGIIESSAKHLAEHLPVMTCCYKFYMPKVGCGNGKLKWNDVEPILDKYLGNQVTIIDRI